MAFDYDYTGNPALLDCRKVAFFASRVVSPTVEEQVLRWAEACCATDRVVISGFQSPLEKSVFELLLKARHPVIWALGRALYRRYPPAVEEALTGLFQGLGDGVGRRAMARAHRAKTRA